MVLSATHSAFFPFSSAARRYPLRRSTLVRMAAFDAPVGQTTVSPSQWPKVSLVSASGGRSPIRLFPCGAFLFHARSAYRLPRLRKWGFTRSGRSVRKYRYTVSLESASPVRNDQRPAICSGDQASRIFPRTNFSSPEPGAMRFQRELAAALRLSRWRWTSLGTKAAGGAFPSSRQASEPARRPPTYLSFLCPYLTPLAFRMRYRVVLFLQRAAATAGMLIPTRSMARTSWSSPSETCFFHGVIPYVR